MIDDQSVPIVVLIVSIVILLAARPIARSSRKQRIRRPRPGPEAIARLAEDLGIGVMVRSVDPGPPAAIAATMLLDMRTFRVVATGATESEAWDALARKVTDFKNHDERNVRTYLGAP